MMTNNDYEANMDITTTNNINEEFLNLATHAYSIDSSTDHLYSNKPIELTKNDHFLLNECYQRNKNFVMRYYPRKVKYRFNGSECLA